MSQLSQNGIDRIGSNPKEKSTHVIGGPIKLLPPLKHRKGNLRKKPYLSLLSGKEILDYVQRHTGLEWRETRLLDFGCGVKFTQSLLQFDVQIKKYVGLDVDGAMIKYLKDNVDSNSFEFHHLNFHNEMYNKDSKVKMYAGTELPIEEGSFDLVTLQSVFTHCIPSDVDALLQILHRYLKPGGWIFFTCFVDDHLKENFVDSIPEKPLFKALYRKAFMQQMIINAGYEIQHFGLSNPSGTIIDHFFCKKPF